MRHVTGRDLLAQVVEYHDVGIHVEEVVGVRRVVVCRPALWLGAAKGEHVVAVLGLVIHTVEPRQLHTFQMYPINRCHHPMKTAQERIGGYYH